MVLRKKDGTLSNWNVVEPLLDRKVLPIILIGITLAVLQQWCGINVIFLYAEEVFTSAGYTVSGMLFNVVITGSINLIFTLVAMRLVDSLGRKTLLLTGTLGLTILFTATGAFYKLNILGKVPITEIAATIKSLSKGAVFAIVLDGAVDTDVVKATENVGVQFLVAMSSKVKPGTARVSILTGDDL